MATLKNYGGPILANVQVQALYLGSWWNSHGSLVTQLEAFIAYIVASPYMDMLTNAGFGVGRGTSFPGIVDPMAMPSSIADQQIQQEVQSQITAQRLHSPGPNNLFLVYVPPGIVVTESGETNFLGYHSCFIGSAADGSPATIHYAVILSQSALIDQLSFTTSHELAEGVTDPEEEIGKLGWDAFNVGEIADLAGSKSYRLNGWLVTCVAAPSMVIVDPTLPPPPPLPSPVTGLLATAGSSGQVHLSWAHPASGGISGYQIMGGIASTVVQPSTSYARVSPSQNSYTISGLVPGVAYAFQIISLNDSQQTKSSVVTITVPSP